PAHGRNCQRAEDSHEDRGRDLLPGRAGNRHVEGRGNDRRVVRGAPRGGPRARGAAPGRSRGRAIRREDDRSLRAGRASRRRGRDVSDVREEARPRAPGAARRPDAANGGGRSAPGRLMSRSAGLLVVVALVAAALWASGVITVHVNPPRTDSVSASPFWQEKG